MMFFELIQLALGQRDGLSRELNGQEWQEVYQIATKQALLGVCFAGIQRLSKEQAPPKELLFRWFGAAQSIIKRNAQLTEQCRILQERLKESGIRSAILKGQGVARYYVCPKGQNEKIKELKNKNSEGHTEISTSLAQLRQPGDIDVYVDCGRERAIAFAHAIGQKDVEWDYKHLHLEMFPGTEVEVHYRVEVLLNIWKNRKLQRWFKENEEELFRKEADGMVMPSTQFDRFYILLHIYRHFLYEGVGLRQVLDYYFVLRHTEITDGYKGHTEITDLSATLKYKEKIIKSLESTEKNLLNTNVTNLSELLKGFGMWRFTQGLMWVLQEVFMLEDEYLIAKPLEKEGKVILKSIMEGGNFGHHSEKGKRWKRYGKVFGAMTIAQHNMHLVRHYPMDAITAPLWPVWHYFWKRSHRNLGNHRKAAR